MPTSTVPAEIWVYVSQYIPQHTLCSMISINKTFYQLAMDARYKHVDVFTFDDASLERMRKLRDPVIAPRVRRLRVKPRFRHGQYINSTHDSSLEIAEIMTTTITCFTNVIEFSIDWAEGPDEQLLPFITAAWKTFGPGLQKLSFRVQMRHLTALLPTADSLSTLKGLCVDLLGGQDILQGPKMVDSGALTTLLAQFVNKVAPTLRILILSSLTYDIDFSPLFCQLRNIPNLERFGIFIPHEASTSEVLSAFGLAHFLQSHVTTLRHLCWNGDLWDKDFMGQDGQNNEHSRKQRLLDWLKEYEFDKVFSNLFTLRLSVAGLGAEWSLLMQCIISSAATLDSLRLDHKELSYDDVQTLGHMLADRRTQPLRELDIAVHLISPELIWLLAHYLPSLEHLRIEFSHMTAQNGAEEVDTWDAEQELVVLQKFEDALSKCDIPRWALHDIRITKFYPWDERIHIDVMWVLAECIPSVRTFDGVEKEFYAESYGKSFNTSGIEQGISFLVSI